jgi:hypothetical protein
MPDILPSCTTRELRGRTTIDGVVNIPIHCMNCGHHYGYAPETITQPGGGYVGYLCQDCAEKWSPLVGTMCVPDEVFAQKAAEAQLEQFGHLLSPLDAAKALDDPGSQLSKLVRDRLGPSGGA